MLHPPTSLWWSTLTAPVAVRPALSRHLDVDVAIVGGGYTGLWTARELLRRDPTLQIAVLEQSVCGFGASGRNGGWASALYPVDAETVIGRYGRDAFDHQRSVLQRSVTDLGSAAALDGIEADYVRGGTLTFARSEVQASRLRAAVAASRDVGVGDDDLRWLDADEATRRGRVEGALGATYTPHCARVHPAKLVRGLSDVVESLGAQVFEDTRVLRIEPAAADRRARVLTAGGAVRADYVVRATEGFTPTIAGHRRDVAPIYSLMIATEPLAATFWDEVGFAAGETFYDDRHLYIYAQRTADGRIAFGGRGAPYHFGSTVEPRFDANDRVFALLESTLRELLPTMTGSITHRWGGPLAMPRDLSPAVHVDAVTGLASAGGYTGDGVVLSRVSAQALADLITAPDDESEFTRLPFVQRTSRKWEIEPLRWLGINVGLGLATYADRVERRRGVPSRAGRWLDALTHGTVN